MFVKNTQPIHIAISLSTHNEEVSDLTSRQNFKPKPLSRGYLELRAIEEDVLLSIPLESSVLATGGSAIYSKKAMKRLKAETFVVYLKTPLELIKSRVGDFIHRGIAASENATIESLAAERINLYEKYADLELCTSEKTPSTISEEIVEKLFSQNRLNGPVPFFVSMFN